MVEITLVEIHLEDAQFDANAEAIANAPLSGLRGLFGSDDEEESSDEGAVEEVAEEASADESTATRGRPGPSLGKLFLGVLLLAVVGIAARRFLGGGEEGAEPAADEAVEIAEIDVGE
jgi:hypothetical protein